MKVVVAIDSFKGSLSSLEAANAIYEGIKEADRNAQIVIKPLADGGEGTVSAFINGINAEEVKLRVTGPLGEPVDCTYAMLREAKTAVIEVASAAGLTQVPEELKNPLNTTSYGVGELIRDAIGRSCRTFIIGIGGSATNDCGLGMLEALGFRFLDKDGQAVGPYGKDVERVERVITEYAEPALSECSFKIACDVNNPLCGANGASAVFGPQKGATEEIIKELDAGLYKFSEVTKQTLRKDMVEFPGTGAAGGLGYAFKAYLNGDLEPGSSIVLEAVEMEKELKDTDIVVTGEGKLDSQTAMGKAPLGVAKLAKKYNCRVIAFAGAVMPEAAECNQAGIDAYFPIVRGPIRTEEAMRKEVAFTNLKDSAKQVFRLLKQ